MMKVKYLTIVFVGVFISFRVPVCDAQDGVYIGAINNIVLPQSGSPVTVSCPVTTTVNSVNWFMYTDETSTVNVFTGNDFDVTTPGRYYCEVAEERGVYRSNSFIVFEIGFASSFTRNPENLTVYYDTSRYAFECQIVTFASTEDDLNLMRIEWDGAMTSSEEFQLQDSQFSFNPLPGYSIFVRDVNGPSFDLFPNRYRCRAVFTLPNGAEMTVATSDTAFIIQMDMVGSGGEFGSGRDTRDFLLTPSDVAVTEMDTAVFVCVPADPLFEAMWLFDTLNTVTGPNGYYIRITDVEMSDRVSCMTNGNSSSANLIVQEVPVLLIDSVLSNFTLVREGSNVTLECSPLMTTPTPTITWLANGSVVQVGTNQYTIDVVDETSRGVYQCLVEATFTPTTNSVGLPLLTSFASTTLLDTFCVPNVSLSVNGATTDSGEYNITFGDSFNITCQLSCPTSLVTWTQDSISISNSSLDTTSVDGLSVEYTTNIGEMVTSSVLFISMASMNNTGSYQCVATVQNIQADSKVDVFVYVQTMIITPPEDQAVALGENVTFTCTASGTSPPNIVWAQIVDGNTKPISNDVEMLEMGNTVNSTLTISDVKEDDFGDYRCIAGDSFSADVANFTVYEAVVPSTPVNLTAVVTGSRETTVSWQEGVPLNPVNPAVQRFDVFLNDSLISSLMTTTIVLSSLTPFNDYRVTVVARNRIGMSNMSDPVLFMTEEEAPGAPPQNLIAHSPSTGTITAAWSPPTPLELQYGILSGYEISFGIAESNITQISFSSDLSITRTGLLSNITYSITVAAVNGAGTSDNTTTLNINLPPSLSDIMLPNNTVPVERIEPTSIIVDLPTTDQPFSHVWVIAVRLSSTSSSVLFSNTNEDYPTRESFKTYFTAGDDEPYIVAETSAENYPMTFVLGDHSLTANISDFPDLDFNGPLTEGRGYSVFVRFFSFNGPALRTRRTTFPDRQYSVFTSTEFSEPIATANVISFGEPVYIINENSELAVDLVLSSSLSINVTVQINSDDVTATGRNVDYYSGPYNVTVLAGNTTGFLNIMLNDDKLLEETEKFNLTIDLSSFPVGIFPGNYTEALVVIMDNDETTINFNQSSYTVVEDTMLLQPVLTLSNPSASDIVVQVESSDINATENMDYISGPYTNIIIPSETLYITFNVSIMLDDILEGNEAFYLKINSSLLRDNVTTGSFNTTSVIILDDDFITITFSQSTYTTDEDSGAVQVELVFSNPSMTDITVQVNTIDITTNGDDDYVTGPYNVTLFAGMTRRRFNISLVNNNILELSEIFNITVDSNLLPDKVSFSNQPSQVFINDDDLAVITFNQLVYNTTEDNGLTQRPSLIQPQLLLSIPSSFGFAIRVNTESFNATAGGSAGRDYNPGPYDVTFQANVTNVTFNVAVEPDDLLEGDEVFLLRLASSSLPDAVTAGDVAIVVITDNDPISINFSQSLYTSNENTMTVQPILLLTNPSSTDVTVQVMSINITAFGRGIDYDSGPFNLIIPARRITFPFSIEIIDDNILEDFETFNLTINSLSLPASVGVTNPDQTTIVIIDNDAIAVTFTQSLYPFAENNRVGRPELVFTNPSYTDITLTIVSSDNNATGGANVSDNIDYISGPYNVTFPAGVTRVSFDIVLKDDGVTEGRESFNLIISDMLHPNVTFGEVHQAVVSIVDDASVIMFNQSTYEVDESEPQLQVALVVNVPLSNDTDLHIEAIGITATGDDYQIGIYSETLVANTMSTLVSVNIKEDTILEPQETFMLTILSTSLSATLITGSPDEAIVTIIDNDRPLAIEFSQSTFVSSESSTNITVTLVLDGGTSSSDITITVILSEQSPLSAEGDGVDYTSTPLVATFVVGTNRTEISIPITEDEIIETEEEFELIFTIPLSISDVIIAGTNMTATGVIIDSTVAKMTFNQSVYMVGESDGEVHLEINLSNQTAQSVNLTVEILADRTNATGGVDYRSGPYSLVLSAGTQSVSFNISVYDDNILEYNEIFTITITIDDPTLSDRISTDTTTVIIIDNDPITVNFNQSMIRTQEDNGTIQFGMFFSNPSVFELNISVNTISGTAMSGVDFVPGPYVVTFPTNTTSIVCNISIVPDQTLEVDETFEIVIDSASLPIDVFSGTSDEVALVIVDDDPITVNFSQPSFSFGERGEIAEPVIMFSNPSSFSISVHVETNDITATGVNTSKCLLFKSKNDYRAGVYTVTIPVNITLQRMNISVCNDIVLEVDEQFSVTILSNSHPDNVTIGNPSQAIVTIEDNNPITIFFDSPTFFFGQPTLSFNESDGTIQLRVNFSHPSDTNITLLIDSKNNTAYSDMDYHSVQSSVSFPAFTTEGMFNFTLQDDNIFEFSENFSISIHLETPSARVNIPNNTAVVVIHDDDPITLNFSQSAYHVNENTETAQLTVHFSNPSSFDIMIRVNTMDINATEGVDYICTPSCAVTFATGETTEMFTITIFDNMFDNDEFEGLEHFSVNLLSPDYIIKGNPSEAVILIVDIDDIILERPFTSLILLEGTTITLSCNPTLFQEFVTLYWTHNGTNVSDTMDGITFSPVDRNHNLIIESPVGNQSGIYRCIAAPTVSLSFDITVVENCEEDFSGGVLWPSSRRRQFASRRCSELHPSFRSGVSINRYCGADGQWLPPDLRDCTMFNNSNPLVVVYVVFNRTVTDLATVETVAENIVQDPPIEGLAVINVASSIRRLNTTEGESIAMSVTFTLEQSMIPVTLIETVRRNTLDLLPPSSNLASADIGVLAFQPNLSCTCNVNADLNTVQPVCIGPSTPPCICDTSSCKCNSPTYVGDGNICAIDTDYDEFPDVNLNCDLVPSCEGDLCPDIFSAITDANGVRQDGSFCAPTVDIAGCPMEPDPTWNILWPATIVNSTAIQKCPGGGEAAGLATRRCVDIDMWEDPDVSNCTTVEQTRLSSQITDVQRVVANILNNETRDLTERFESELVINIASELNVVTNSSTPLVPNDVDQTDQTLGSIVNVAELTNELVGPVVILQICENCTSVLSNVNDERNDVSFQENETVSENLVMTTERVGILLGSTLNRSSIETVNISIVTENIIMDALLPTMDTVETVTFPKNLSMFSGVNVSGLQIVIPEQAILNRFSAEGDRLPIVNSLTMNTRLPTNETQRSASVLLSSQISTTTREPISLDGERITLFAELDSVKAALIADPRCVFWDFRSGSFSEGGITTISNGSFVSCSSDHLTSFAVLVNVRDVPVAESTALSIVTYIGCGISIICLIVGLIIMILFSKQLKKAQIELFNIRMDLRPRGEKKVFNQIHHFIHFNLSLSLLLGLILFVSGIETAKDSRVGCLIVAILLHYFFMAVFFWMLCEGILLVMLLYFVFYQGIFKTWKFFILAGWGPPVIVVAISAAVSHDHYGNDDMCWISNENGAIWGFIAPMLLIIVVNAVLYVGTLIKVLQSKKNHRSAEASSMTVTAKTLLVAAVFLLPLFGLTWVFGLLAVNEDTIAFAWIFTILNSLQGLFIFFFYVLKNEKLRKTVKSMVDSSTTGRTDFSSDKYDTVRTGTGTVSRVRGWFRSEGATTARRRESVPAVVTSSLEVPRRGSEPAVLTSWQSRSDIFLESAPPDKQSTQGNVKTTVDLENILEEQENN